MSTRPTNRAGFCWGVLALPLLVIQLWVFLDIGYYTYAQFAGGAIAAMAFCALVVLIARWRPVGAVSWIVAWLLYAAGLLIEIGEAISFYFQASSFNIRFFANVRLENLRSGLDAFPALSWVVGVVLVGMGFVAARMLWRQSRMRARDSFLHAVFKGAIVVLLAAIAVSVPSAGHRLASVFTNSHAALASNAAGHRASALVNMDLVSREDVRASAGRNLVIIYMESLERIYTDEKIFPGLTPNLNHWRAQGLDYSGYLTFAGADYTMAGLFSSQCGAPYLPSPERAFGFGGNDANATSFQPGLACLGDVLHAAGYTQAFMNGSPLSFADQGAFFHIHGFDNVLGLDELEDESGHQLRAPGWGLYDDDLFRLAEEKFDRLAASGKPFNLDLLTIDDHPEHGRPSPGCPAYKANSNSMLQAVHCTDYLVGKFLASLQRNPAWKRTVVVVMSDHESLRNDAWPLYPASYQRRPLLFVLNAGQGERKMRFYHMDIAPTVLHLLGVSTNASFIAGADRSAPNAPDSPLVNNAADLAILQKALWTTAQPLALCKGGVLVGAAQGGVEIGGHHVPMLLRGARRVGLSDAQNWLLAIGQNSIRGGIEEASGLRSLLAKPADDDVLLMQPQAGNDSMRQFTVDWIGRRGADARLALVPRLRGLQITSPDCAALIKRVDRATAGQRFDFSTSFAASTAPLYPVLPSAVRFSTSDALPLERELGWTPPQAWGSFTLGSVASLGFTLPRDQCHAVRLGFVVRPFLPASRPILDVKVLANGAEMTTWHFGQAGDQTWHFVNTPVRTSDPQCRVDLRFEFARRRAAPLPHPAGEDPRPLQLDFLKMEVAPAAPGLQAQVEW